MVVGVAKIPPEAVLPSLLIFEIGSFIMQNGPWVHPGGPQGEGRRRDEGGVKLK